MNISKISRSIVVAIFVALIIFLGSLDITLIVKGVGDTSGVSSNLIKFIYAVVIIMLVSIYVYLKDRLYQMKVKRSISLIYRYIYITLVVVFVNLMSIYKMINELSIFELLLYVISTYIISIIIKRIIFNVSRSDILSILGMFMFAALPNAISDMRNLSISIIFSLVFFAALLLIQIIIDELKQKGIKTKKYILESLLLGISIGFSLIFGFNIIIWCVIAIAMIFITIDLDNTHISFPKKIMKSITGEQREKLYKFERININKLYVVIVLCAITSCITYQILFSGINNITKFNITSDITQNVNNSKTTSFELTSNKIYDYSNSLLSFSKDYYLVLFIYILALEILSFVLNRRYDTKSTVMKLLFITLLATVFAFDLSIYYYQPLITVLLIIIAIVNTSNIYLNREERIKMLVSK